MFCMTNLYKSFFKSYYIVSNTMPFYLLSFKAKLPKFNSNFFNK